MRPTGENRRTRRSTTTPRRQRPATFVLCSLILAALALAGPGSSTALAVQPPEYAGSFGPDGTSASAFGRAASVAVDQKSHAVYVYDSIAETMSKFDIEGKPVPFTGSAANISGNSITELPPHKGFWSGRTQIAVDSISHRIYVTSGDVLRAFEASGEPAFFAAGPGAGTDMITGFEELNGVTVDGTGNIYAGEASRGGLARIHIYGPTGLKLPPTIEGLSEMQELGVDSAGLVYSNVEGLGITRLHPSSYPVTTTTEYKGEGGHFVGGVTPGFAVDPATDDVYASNSESRILRYNTAGDPITSFGGAGEDGDIGLAQGIGIDGSSAKIFVADADPPSQVRIFQPVVAAPTIESTFSRSVAARSATLVARINPNSRPTEYHFEYGTSDCSVPSSSCASVPLPDASAGDGHEVVVLPWDVSGLSPSTTYHYRIVAANDLGTATGPDRTFTTQAVGLGFELSDSRVWEMVSPPNKSGARVVAPLNGPTQAAADGNGVAFQTVLSLEEDAEGNRAIERSMVIAKRSGSSWTARDITPPHHKATTVTADGTEYRALSADLSRALFRSRDDTPLSVKASGATPYLRINTDPPSFEPLVTSKEGYSNVAPGIEISPDTQIFVRGTDRSLSTVALSSPTPLVSGTKTGLTIWKDGTLSIVGVLPPDEGGSVVGGDLGSGEGSIENAISDGGARVFWGRGGYSFLGGATTEALYARDVLLGQTVRLDVAQPGASEIGTARPVFQGANTDGTAVFFTDTRQLTADASPEGRDLYRCELPPAGTPGGCQLTNLTAATSEADESARVQGLAPAFGDDGDRAYFVARGVLDGGANPAGESAVSGAPNLYLWQEEVGPRFIATLSEDDYRVWGNEGRKTIGATTRNFAAAGSPAGRYFSFTSERSLTGYENTDAESGFRDQEVFVYDAVQDSLLCASCNVTGASPEGATYSSGAPFVDPLANWWSRWTAAILPEARFLISETISQYRPRAVLDNGRVFFNGIDALVPADANGQWDVYQYEPTGTGSCAPNSGDGATIRMGEGCVSLLSSGRAGQEAAFLDASESGDDVFFLTTAKLSVTDVDDEYDVYDARVNGIAANREERSECLGEACQPAAVAPNDPTPGTATFQGFGNLRQKLGKTRCPKGKRKVTRKGRVRCVAHKKKPGQASSSGGGRRAGR